MPNFRLEYHQKREQKLRDKKIHHEKKRCLDNPRVQGDLRWNNIDILTSIFSYVRFISALTTRNEIKNGKNIRKNKN